MFNSFRSSCGEVSTEFLKAIKQQKYDGKVLYVQLCLMANGGACTQQISSDKNIQNPYFGTQMHPCGGTVQQIEF